MKINIKNMETYKDIDLFDDIDNATIEYLIKKNYIFINSYTKSNTVHYQGKHCNSLDIVISGKLMAYSLSKKGTENILFEFTKNNIIGTNLLFGNSNIYPLDIYSIDNCELLHIKKEGILILLKNYNFTLNFIKYLSNNSIGMNDKIRMYSQKSLRENLLEYFVSLSIEQETDIIYLPISKKQLADYLGVQRPSLFRELKKLKDEGLIKIENRTIDISIINQRRQE